MENTKIMTIDGYEYELVYIDSTHFKMKNLHYDDCKWNDYVVYHIGQFQGRDCYDEINNWLHSQKYLEIIMKTFILYTDADYNHKTSAVEAEVVFPGCYFHGEAESILGHDIVCVERKDLLALENGIHDFLVYDRESMDIIVFGKLFIWDGGAYHNPHGLAIMDGDDEGMNYAKHCMEIEQDYC